MVYTRTSIALLASHILLLPLSVSAVPQNTTVDDSDQVAINYWTDANWNHDPLAGYEQFFVNGTRSFTYVPGAAALFNFTGTGIYLQGPHSNDQAVRSVTLDGQDMGNFTAYAPERLPTEGTSSIFWGVGGLPNTLHTVAVAHADTADKILVMDAWIYEADSSQLPQGSTGTSTAGSPSSPSSTSGPNSNSNSSDSNTTSTSTTMSKTPIIIGIAIPLLLLLLCIAGFCLFRRRRQRTAQRQRDTIKEKMFPARSNPMRLSQPVYPASQEYHSSNDSQAELGAAAGAVGSGGALPSYPFHNRPRAASDTYNNSNANAAAGHEDSLGLSNHPLFIPTAPLNLTTNHTTPLNRTPSAVSAVSDTTESHYPTPPPYAGAPMLFFSQRPDPIPPINSDYAPQPIVNGPSSSPSMLRRFSGVISGVIPGLSAVRPGSRSASRNSMGNGGERRTSVLTDFRYNTTTTSPRAQGLGLDVERAASPPRSAYFPYPPPHYLPSSPNSTSIPLSPISTGFARNSANLEKLGDLKYETENSNLSTVDTLHTGARTPTTLSGDGYGYGYGGDVKVSELAVDRGLESKREAKPATAVDAAAANPFDDEYAFSSYTRLTRDEVMRSRPVSSVSVNNPQ